jgi:hypothetical protein
MVAERIVVVQHAVGLLELEQLEQRGRMIHDALHDVPSFTAGGGVAQRIQTWALRRGRVNLGGKRMPVHVGL